MTSDDQIIERSTTMPKLVGIAVALAVMQIVTLAVITARLPEPDSHSSPRGIRIVALPEARPTSREAGILDPTMFVLPHREGVSGAVWMRPYKLDAPRTNVKVPSLSAGRKPDDPVILMEGPGMETDESRLIVDKPPTREFDVMEGVELAEVGSRIRFEGWLQGRVLRAIPEVPRIRTSANVFPTVLRVIVDELGSVTGVALTGSSGSAEADALAKKIVSEMHFEPMSARMLRNIGSGYSSGRAIFEWKTEPPKESRAEAGE